MLIDANKVQPGFLFSERTSGASSVIFIKGSKGFGHIDGHNQDSPGCPMFEAI